MAANRKGQRSRRGKRGERAVQAATAAILAIAFLVALLATLLPDGFVIATPPAWFWIAFPLLVGLTIVGFAALSRPSVKPTPRPAPRPAAKSARASKPRVHVETPPASEPEETAPPLAEEDIDTFLAKLEADGPFAPSPGALAAVEGPEEPASDIPELTKWLDGIEAQVTEWAETAASVSKHVVRRIPREEGPKEEPEDQTRGWRPVLVTAEGEEEPTESKAGAWTETRARSAIERYLRVKPWAPATHVAEALEMDLGLAIRLVESVRRSMYV